MKSLLSKFLGMIMVLLLVTACTSNRIQPIYKVQNHPLPRAAANLRQDQLDRIAHESAVARGWLVDKTVSGQFRIIQKWRTHSAEADLRIGPGGYSILFVSSNNLREGEGHIHRAYNNHVTALEAEIERRLFNTGT